MPVLNTVVLWVHIFGAIGWLGAALVFGMIIGPSLAKMSPQARTEFFAKVVPRYTRYVTIVALMTLVFGVAMVAVLGNGSFSVISLSTSFGLYISIGAVLALVTMVLALTVVVPSANKVAKLSENLLKTPGPPPPELLAAGNRLKMGSTAAMILLILVTIFMVSAVTL